MTPLEWLDQVLNFLAPALFVAVATPLAARIFMKKAPNALIWWSQIAINFAVGAGVLLAGLWYFGYDGKMATYAALVLGCATSQWLMARGWRH